MALQTRGADKRLYNPDRDMIWAMPRIMMNALKRFGENITSQDVREQMAKRCITVDCSDNELQATVEQVVSDFARFLNDLKDKPDVRREPDIPYTDLFASNVPIPFHAVRVLLADYFMGVIYAELPIWFESVQPENESNPVPRTEEVVELVEKLVGHSIRDTEEEDADDRSA